MSENLAKEADTDNTESVADAKDEKSQADALYPDEGKKDDDKSEGESQEKQTETETKEDEAKPSENKVPEKYDLKLPEGSQLSKEEVEEIESYAKGQGFSNEQAQKLVEREHEIRNRFVENQKTQLQEASEQWRKDTENDKEIGGEKFKESVNLASQVLKRFGSEGFMKSLETTGFGNHPELIRVFSRIGRAMDSDKLIKGGDAPKAKKSFEEVFYGQN